MTSSILKAQWERDNSYIFVDFSVLQMMISLWTKSSIETIHLLSGGCANTNYKITFTNKNSPIVLRIYTRNKEAPNIEAAIHRLVQDTLPIPKFLYTDTSCKIIPYPFSIIEWIEGIPMREVLFRKEELSTKECAFDAGKYVSILKQIKLPHSGFFQKDLSIQPFTEKDTYLSLIQSLLEDLKVKQILSLEIQNKLQELVAKNADLLPLLTEANLTHGDYDPSNMLVTQIKGIWVITAILDWEFAFAGTYLFDMATMLRYAHKLPKIYELSFIEGFGSSGQTFPLHWKHSIKLLDLLNLLQLLQRDSDNTRPKMRQDISELIHHTLSCF